MRQGKKKIRGSSSIVLGLPEKSAVADWLAVVKKKRGQAKMLACRTGIKLGTRLSEVCAIKEVKWPSSQTIAKARLLRRTHVEMTLDYTKGDKPRQVHVDLHLASMVRTWADTRRPQLVETYVARTGHPPPAELFLSDAAGYEGTPVSPSRLYECYKLRTPGLDVNWYPHKGRHYFTCDYLITNIERDAGGSISDKSASWVHDRVIFWLAMTSEQLGHVDEKTTKLYTRWLVTFYQGGDASDRWAAEFDEGDDDA